MADSVSLPAPFDQVRIVQCEIGDDAVYIRYTGTPEDLVACGAVTAEMLMPGRRGVERLDLDGESFSIDRQRGQPRIRVFRKKAIERARRLPGVAGAIQVMQQWEVEAVDSPRARAMRPSYLRLVVDNTRVEHGGGT